MPRPLPRKSNIDYDPGPAMTARPQLAIYIARVVAGWARVEERIGFLIVRLLGAHAHTGMKMYQALASSAAQLAVLRAVARDHLDAELQGEMEAILKVFKSLARRRANIVHGHWYVSPEHPDDLVWCDSGASLVAHSHFWSGYRDLPEEERYRYMEAYSRENDLPYYLYAATDFRDLLAEMTSLLNRLMRFIMALDLLDYKAGDQPRLSGE